MMIINRDSKAWEWAAYAAASKGEEPFGHLFNALGHEVIYPGQGHQSAISITAECQANGIFLYLYRVGGVRGESADYQKKVFQWGTTVLIYGGSLIDWQGIQRMHIWDKASEEPSQTLRINAAEVASDMFATMGNALDVVPGIDVFSTIFGVIGNLLGSFAKEKEPPPLTAQAVATAVREVMREELNVQFAEQATVCFLGARKFILESAKLAAQTGGLGEEDTKDYIISVHGYVLANTKMREYLDYFSEHPNEAARILPSYLIGLSCFVNLLWQHFVIGQMKGNPLTGGRIEILLDEVIASLNVLTQIRKETEELAIGMLKRYGLRAEIVEGKELYSAMWQQSTGLGSPDILDRSIRSMQHIVDSLRSDIAKLAAGNRNLTVFRPTWLPQIPTPVK